MRQKFLAVILITLIMTAWQNSAFATTYTFSPTPPDLQDLIHGSFYQWGIGWTLPAGEHITSASLTYQQIWDFTHETDHLYTNLLDTVSAGIYTHSDTVAGNEFAGQGLSLGDWNDPYGDPDHKIDLIYYIPDTHFAWLSNGNFGFGIDPDCHYYDSGIVVTINTNVIPEPATMSLLGLGVLGLFGLRKKRV